MVWGAAQFYVSAQTTNLLYPSADAFVRAAVPGNNYGAAGALSVSGSEAVNGSGQTNGPSDSLMRFPLSEFAAAMNAQYGSDAWSVSSVVLTGAENATPSNPVFNRGVGAFEIRWLANNNWIEGSGTPNRFANDGITYQDVAGLLDPVLDLPLGRFTNTGANASVSFALTLAIPLVSNIVAGADVDLYLTAVSPAMGFTFNSRNFVLSNAWPALQIVAGPNFVPRISSISRSSSTEVSIRFNTASNWTYVLQRGGRVAIANWTNAFTNTAQPFDGEAVFVDSGGNGQRFYRLSAFRP